MTIYFFNVPLLKNFGSLHKLKARLVCQLLVEIILLLGVSGSLKGKAFGLSLCVSSLLPRCIVCGKKEMLGCLKVMVAITIGWENRLPML